MKIDKKELSFLIGQGEGYNLEFKEAFSKNIARDICAFANANGGRILVGVSDDGEIKGARITNSLKSDVHTLVRNFDHPLNIGVETLGDLLVINVPEGVNKPYSTNGKFYLRYGTNSQQLARSEIREFFQKEGLVLFDEKPNYDFDLEEDFDYNTFETFLEKAKITPVLSREEILENSFILKDGYMKNAGVLLFCSRITKFFPQATVTCVLYQGKTKYKILDRKEFDADLYSNFQNALIYVQSKLNTEFIIKGGPRVERPELPEEALREALLNAIAHRDYFVSGANILVEIFSDRVEITNPGGLVKGLTKKDLGKKSLSRNNLLFGLMQRMDLVEKVGSGITRMRRAMKDYGLRVPIFDINDNWFTIIFKRPVIWGETTQKTTRKTTQKTTQKLLSLIRENPGATREELAILLEITPDGVKYHIANLKKKGFIKRIGGRKGGRWEVMEK
jgi:ATP-dependent DNA helicase RecG